jgi:hypothetical protein
MKTSGREIHSHIKRRARRVKNGIAVEEACAHTKRLRTKVDPNKKPGKMRAVIMAFFFQLSPLKVL